MACVQMQRMQFSLHLKMYFGFNGPLDIYLNDMYRRNSLKSIGFKIKIKILIFNVIQMKNDCNNQHENLKTNGFTCAI